MKKSLCFLIGFFILFSFNCYAGKTLITQQKEAYEWVRKAISADTLALKIEYCSKAIEIDPKFVVAYCNRGLVYLNLGEYQKAIDDYTKAIEINPKYTYAYYNRGNAYVLQESPTAACGDFYQAGILFLKQKNTKQALICVDLTNKNFFFIIGMNVRPRR